MAAKKTTVTTTVTNQTTPTPASQETVPFDDDNDPSTPPINIHFHQKDRVLWQRLGLSLMGIGIVVGMWRWAVNHLYVLPDHSIVAFTSITNNSMYVVAALVIFFVTGKLIYDWKNTTATTLSDAASHITQDIKSQIDAKTESTNTNVNVDLKGSIVDQNDPNAPELKPFGQHASNP